MNYIWAGMLAVGFLAGMINGRIEEVTEAAFSSAGRAVELGLGLLGIMCLWSGLMKIMEKCGMINFIAKAAQPILKPLFPKLENNDKAMGAIVMNLTANFMGLGNAATPFGIKAMEELQKLNGKKDTATDSMCMFLVLNTSALQLIPATVIAIRSDAGSAAPAEIITCIWAASLCAAFAGILAAKVLKRMWKIRLPRNANTVAAGVRSGTGPVPHGRPQATRVVRYGTAQGEKRYPARFGTAPGERRYPVRFGTAPEERRFPNGRSAPGSMYGPGNRVADVRCRGRHAAGSETDLV
jgi:spore maturation protein A